MKVKIIKATKIKADKYGNISPWYKDDIGEIFDVTEDITRLNKCDNYQVIQNNRPSGLCIQCCDCEVIKSIWEEIMNIKIEVIQDSDNSQLWHWIILKYNIDNKIWHNIRSGQEESYELACIKAKEEYDLL